RARVGLASLSGSMNKTDVLREIEHQRVCELAEEGTRWYDLLRWDGSIDGGLTIKQCLTQHGAIGAATFNPKKHKYLPIPLSEIDTNPEIKQNNGY
ncbi:MAG TPA: RagB/SusD family nutrient uptake outer membrane protein, partial [Chitinophagaceae bacterium]|nr:RagB/SusD family nutrient uptake outer membrane protein [Chitinophagaceae bacterium]